MYGLTCGGKGCKKAGGGGSVPGKPGTGSNTGAVSFFSFIP